MPDPSCVCDLHHSSWQRQIPNPLSLGARDRTPVLMDAIQVHYCWTMMGTPLLQNFEDISHWILNPNFAIYKFKIILISYPLNMTCFSVLFPTWIFTGSSLSQCSESSKWSVLGWVYFLPWCFQPFQSGNSYLTAQEIFIKLFFWSHPRHVEVPSPETEPKSQQWQCWILNWQAPRQPLLNHLIDDFLPSFFSALFFCNYYYCNSRSPRLGL